MHRFTSLLLLLATALGQAEVQTRDVEYTDGGEVLSGFLAHDPSIAGKKPVVLIVHDWDGITDYEKSRARQLAQLGYVAFAVDVYGKNNRPKSMQENAQQAGKYRGNLPLFRSRLAAGLKTATTQPGADPEKVAAIGYCFGGTAVLEMARAGMDVDGVVSFHGGLGTTMPSAGPIKAKIMVVHAAQDPSVPIAQFNAFLAEMKSASADYQTLVYNLDVHSFTPPGPGYSADADRRSWAAMRAFFDEIFGGKR